MPYVNKHIRGFIDPRNITFTIPVIFYNNTFNIISQIISDDLYSYLLTSPLSTFLIPSGDFLINTISTITDYYNERNFFYGLPPDPVCKGTSITSSVAFSVNKNLVGNLSTVVIRSIIIQCDGETILRSFIDSIVASFFGQPSSAIGRFVE